MGIAEASERARDALQSPFDLGGKRREQLEEERILEPVQSIGGARFGL